MRLNVGRGRGTRQAEGADPVQVPDPPLPKPAKRAPALDSGPDQQTVVDLKRRRAQLSARVAELQFDLGGLVYEMAIRDRIRVDVIVQRAAQLQDADAELSEVERILRLEETSTAGSCGNCGAPHSSGAGYCWQCGQPLLQQVPQHAIN
jgi:chorismate mutase